MFDDPATQEALAQIFPLLPWALQRMQEGVDPLLFLDLGPGAKSVIVHNLVMKEGERRFAEVNGIDVADSQGLMHFVLPDALLRVKRAEPRTLRIATNRTVQTLEWTLQLPLEGMADPRNRLHLVYVPDQFWTKITRSVVGVYHANEAMRWRDIDVDAWYEAGGAVVDPFAPEPELPPLTLKPGVVTLPLEELDGTL